MSLIVYINCRLLVSIKAIFLSFGPHTVRTEQLGLEGSASHSSVPHTAHTVQCRTQCRGAERRVYMGHLLLSGSPGTSNMH